MNILSRCIVLFIACSLALSCNRTQEMAKTEKFQVIKPIVKDIMYQNEYVADILSVQYVEVRSRVKGYVEQVHVDEGKVVQAGQLLFTISSKLYTHELQKAEAALKNAIADLKASEVELQNTRTLVEKNIVSKAELKMLEAKVDALKASVEEAEAHKEQAALNVSFSKIKAPYNGIINRIPHKMGSLVKEDDMLTTISDNRDVYAYFNLSETDYLNHITAKNKTETQRVSLILANGSRYNHDGTIETIEGEFDRSTGNIAFRARFPNPERILKHGANGKVLVNKEIENALLVPQKSTFEIQDKLYVFVVNKDSSIEQRNIVPKMRLPNYFIVESGLKSGETIVYEGVQNAKNGDKIIPELVDAERLDSSESLTKK